MCLDCSGSVSLELFSATFLKKMLFLQGFNMTTLNDFIFGLSLSDKHKRPSHNSFSLNASSQMIHPAGPLPQQLRKYIAMKTKRQWTS